MSSCTQSSPSGASPSGSAAHDRAAQRLGRVAVVDALEAHDASRSWCGRDDAITQLARRRTNSRDPGAKRSATIRDGDDVHLAAQAVRPADAPDFEAQVIASRVRLLRDVDGDPHAFGRAGGARRPGAAPGSRGRACR